MREMARNFIPMTKAEGGKPANTEIKQDTKVTVGGRNPFAHHGYVNTPVYHASTLLYRDGRGFLGRHHAGGDKPHTSTAAAARRPRKRWRQAIREIEGPACAGVALLPSGLAAITTALLSVLKSGDHLLVTDSAYGPTRRFCDSVLKRFGVTTTYYDPLIGADIAKLMQPNTRAVLHRIAGLADLRDAGHSGDRRGRAPPRRAGADGQHLGEPAVFQGAGAMASTSRSSPAPNISAAIPT